jgi:poly [ADP-ribose] polymerase 2/3/4
LLEIKELLKGETNERKIERLSKEFYSSIPQEKKETIKNEKDLEEKYEKLQLIKDILEVGEITEGSLYSSPIHLRYKSLRCLIEYIPQQSEIFKDISELILSRGGEKMKIKNIFSLNKQFETENFRDDLPNQKLLFHGSKSSNILGILSRGILMPNIVVSKGIKRSG